MIKKIIPSILKDKAKNKIRSTLHLVPIRYLQLANIIISKGITNMISFSYDELKTKTLQYVESLKIDDFSYKYAYSRNSPTLYASIYACMLYGLHGEIDNFSDEKKKNWADYFNSFQSEEDGYFRDPLLKGEEFEGDIHWGDGWGIRHLAAHIIIAYTRLGYTPKYPFYFLNDYYNTSYLKKWLNGLFDTKGMWSASNYIMNIVTLMQYSRDYMDDKKADNAIQFILNWLKEKQNEDTGLWHNKKTESLAELNNAIRGAYHYFPLFIYENIDIKHKEKIIDNILKTQNNWGGFEEENTPSGACEDIDAIDPLIRFTKDTSYRKEEVDIALKQALVWVLTNYNKDGGFTYMPLTPHEYGAHTLTSSLAEESNLMATWFRTLCLAYMTDYLGIPNSFDIKRFPGYEIPL